MFSDWDRGKYAPDMDDDAEDDYALGVEDDYALGIEDDQDLVQRRNTDVPIFKLHKLDWCPSPQHGSIKDVSVGNNIILIGTDAGFLIRWNMFTDEVEEMEVVRNYEDVIFKVFVDPTGTHAVVSMKSGKNYYLHSRWRKPILASKLSNVIITCIAWNKYSPSDSSTKPILIGGSDGKIYETLFEDKDKYFKLVYEFDNEDQYSPICGIEVEHFPTQSSEQIKMAIVVATPTRLYQFIGGPTYDNLFYTYSTTPASPSLREVSGDLHESVLQMYCPLQQRAQSCVWLSGPGIYFGHLVFGSQKPGEEVISEAKLVNYPPGDDARRMTDGVPPLSLCLSQYHFLLVYANRILAINQLSDEIVFEHKFSRHLGMCLSGCCVDRFSNQIWVFSDRFIFEVEIIDEDRDMWQINLQNLNFSDAIKFCKDTDQEEIVHDAEADYYFSQGSFDLAAKFYASTSRSFEEVSLKFINANARDALKTYLLQKLERLSEADITQKTMLATWLTEIYLVDINRLHDEDEDAYYDCLDAFGHFLEQYKDHLNRETTFDLISSHGRVVELLFFAELIGDLDWVVNHHIQNGDYMAALEVLETQSDAAKIEDLYYKYCAMLMHEIPRETVNMLIKTRGLDPCKLLPALMRYENVRGETSTLPSPVKARVKRGAAIDEKPPAVQDHAIRYLEHCVRRRHNTDPAIHNYMVNLYTKLDDEEPLLKFLQRSGKDPIYDTKYALRLCHQEGKVRSAVIIYHVMGLHEDAVKLSLTIDVNLAKEMANDCGDYPEAKKLWLFIAKHVIENEKDVSKATAILTECELLKIDDILPFFPDNVQIGDFKDQICESLEEYNDHIEQLKEEMNEYTTSAALIRKDLAALRNRCGYVGARQKCDYCSEPVLRGGHFFVFPCTHVFHDTCVTKELRAQAERRNRRAVDAELKLTSSLSASSKVWEKRQQHNQKLLDQAGAECIFCGNSMIDSVNEPFLLPDEDEEIKSWRI